MIDRVVDEPVGGTHRDVERTAEQIRQALMPELSTLTSMITLSLVEMRYQRLMKFGEFSE